MKSGNLNFLEPSGPLQACNGTALALTKSSPTDNIVTKEPTELYVFRAEVLVKQYRDQM